MRYLVDTDYVADFLKGRLGASDLLTRLAPEGLAISLITYGEIYEGIYYGRNPRAHESGFLTFLRGVSVLPLTRPIMRRFARIRGELRAQGQTVGDPDLLIAATALHHDLVLISRNVKDFRRVPDLTLFQSR